MNKCTTCGLPADESLYCSDGIHFQVKALVTELREQNAKLQATIERVKYQIRWFDEAYNGEQGIRAAAIVKAFSSALSDEREA